ncbi:MAG: amidohydrolase [Flavobacteriaceae bacterium]|nr:amidohydrolase [Flavobacteriaceae bacterium]
MQNKFKVALIQSQIVWENAEQNRIKFKAKINAIKENVDLVILPELFSTGFSMNPEPIAESMEGETIKWMKRLASEKQSAITGSIVIKDDNNYYNRLLFVHPSGEINIYDKKHTFTFAGEDKAFASGNKKLIVIYKGWKICPLVCYDLRFPVWSRNLEDYDVLLYTANWPTPRMVAWNTLLKARAIENMSYCIGVNRVGSDNLGNEFSGYSGAYDVMGEKISTIQPNKEQTEVVVLDKNHIKSNREKFQFLNDRDSFTLK